MVKIWRNFDIYKQRSLGLFWRSCIEQQQQEEQNKLQQQHGV